MHKNRPILNVFFYYENDTLRSLIIYLDLMFVSRRYDFKIISSYQIHINMQSLWTKYF